MIKYENYTIRKKDQYTELKADIIVLMDDESEIYYNGTPLIWDATFLERVPIDDFAVYHICVKVVPSGKYNRITDYQKIWKLNDISPGIYDNSFLSQNGKVYFGVTRSESFQGFYSNDSALVILAPKDIVFPCEMIFQFFKNSICDSADDVDFLLLKGLYNLIPRSHIMLYGACEDATLKIYSPSDESPFTESDVFLWEGQITSPVYRKNSKF